MGKPSKTGCRTAKWRKRRVSYVQFHTLYVVRLEVYYCWKAVWSSQKSAHVPEVYDVQPTCQISDVDAFAVKVAGGCVTSTRPFVWNKGERGGYKINAQADLNNCIWPFPENVGCVGTWHEDLTLLVFGNGTWKKE